jgi:hypothetical protein
MPDRHKRPPLSLRLPRDDESWVRAHAAVTGRPVSAVIADAVRLHRQQAESDPGGYPREGNCEMPAYDVTARYLCRGEWTYLALMSGTGLATAHDVARPLSADDRWESVYISDADTGQRVATYADGRLANTPA